MTHEKLGFSLVEILVVVAVLAIVIAMAIPRYINANRNAQNTAAQAYAHHMAGWLASAETGNLSAQLGSFTGSCLRAELQREGAPDALPVRAVADCDIQFADNRYTVTVTSVSGTGGVNNDGKFTASY